MQPKSWMMFRLLLNRFYPGKAEELLRATRREEVRNPLLQNITSNDLELFFASPRDWVSRIHYSWLTNELRNQQATQQALFTCSLYPSQAEKVHQALSPTTRLPTLSEAAKRFFSKKFYQKMKPENLLPIPFLPNTPLMPLLKLNKGQLVKLIDYLSLYDLATEIRQIIDKRILQKIYQCLTSDQQNCLRICMGFREKNPTNNPLKLESWNGECEVLEHALHKKGIERFGKGISGQHPDFIWYIVHTLDAGRGTLLSRYISTEGIPGVTSQITIQIIDLIDFMHKKATA